MKEVKRRRKQRSDIYERWAGHRARVVKRWKRCLQVRREISLKTIIDCFLWDHVSLGEWKQQFCCKKLLSMESSHNKERDYNISLLVSMTRVPIRLHKSRSTIADAFSLMKDSQTIHHCSEGCYGVRKAILYLLSVIIRWSLNISLSRL